MTLPVRLLAPLEATPIARSLIEAELVNRELEPESATYRMWLDRIEATRRLIAAIALAPADWVSLAPCWMMASACTGAARSGDHEAPNTSHTTIAAT